ncbi:MAG TPA: dTDP-4-dehydrorhamnose reductase [Balneolaceae bacterium]|nr:dTDP-4-dehydrorhamnose reductase [Balneolaceae bacterium]
MNIVLLGASGQLGREWKSVVDKEFSKTDDLILLPYTSSQLDITNHKAVRKELQKQQPDIVINCAAFTDVDGAEEQRDKAHLVNVEAVENLAAFSADLGFKLIHYSTDYVFPGRLEDKETFPDGYAEDHPADPINYYGRTKWEGEQAILRSTRNYLIVRVSWLCGQFGNNFVKTMLRLGFEREQLQVVDDQFGSPTFAEDVVQNSLKLIRSDETGTFHLTSHGLTSWFDLAKEIFEQRGIDVKVEPVNSDAFPTKARRPHFSKLSTKKLESVPGTILVNWRDGLESLLSQV